MSDTVSHGGEPQSGPLAIINRAVELKLGADEIGKLIKLHEGMEDRRAQAAFQVAMIDCQKAMPVVVRDRMNNRTNSAYVSLDRINISAKPIYTKFGFYISFREEPCQREGWVRTVAEVGHEAGHRQTAYMELPRDGTGPKGEPIGGMNAVQGVCSTNTYAERRLLCRIFNIAVANEDHDGEQWISGEEAAEIIRILKKVGADLGRFLGWAGVKLADPLKPQWDDVRSIYFASLRRIMDDLTWREKEFDKKNGGES